MTWVKVVPPPHNCQMPETAAKVHGRGSVWECEHCGARYTFLGAGNGGWIQAPKPLKVDKPEYDYVEKPKRWWR